MKNIYKNILLLYIIAFQMLFNALFLTFGIFARMCNSTHIESQNLTLYNETDARNLGLKKFVNKKNLIKVAKIAIKIGVAVNPALSGVATGIRIAQKLLEARNKLKSLDALKSKTKSLKNIKNLNPIQEYNTNSANTSKTTKHCFIQTKQVSLQDYGRS